MSKSRGNVINPDDVVSEYGADSLRLYEMFMGPLEAGEALEHERRGRGVPVPRPRVADVRRRPGRRRRARTPPCRTSPPTDEQVRLLHKTIKAVTDDIEKLSLQHGDQPDDGVHERLHRRTRRGRGRAWSRSCCCSPRSRRTSRRSCGNCSGIGESLAYEPWPTFDEAKLVESEIEIPGAGERQAAGEDHGPGGCESARDASSSPRRMRPCRRNWRARRSSRSSRSQVGW